jgi:hypothetical protein
MCRPSIECAALAPLPWHSNDYSADRHRALGFHDVGLLKRTSVSPGPELTPPCTRNGQRRQPTAAHSL